MKAIQLLAKELGETIKNRKVLIPLIAVLFIPLLYTGMFLWSFWDPYGKMDQLPVAVVNLDKGAEMNGENLAIGDDLIDKLKDNDKFKWTFVSYDDAINGLNNQDFYMMVKIPEDFSKNATTLLNEHPASMEIDYIPNESFNFLSSQIGETAVGKIKEEVANEVSKTYAEQIFANLSELGDGLQLAGTGANEIHDGIASAQTGSEKITTNLETFAKSAISFKEGAVQAADGSTQIHSGVSQLYQGTNQLLTGMEEKQPKINQFTTGINQLNTGMTDFGNGIVALEAGHTQLLQGGQQALQASQQIEQGLASSVNGLEKVDTKLGELANGTSLLQAGTEKLATSASQLQEGTGQLKTSSIQLNKGLEQLKQQLQPALDNMSEDKKQEIEKQLNQLVAGSSQLSQGMTGLDSNMSDFKAGASTLADKTTQINQGQTAIKDGFAQLVAGQKQLKDGSSKLVEGQTKLVSGLNTFEEKMQEAKSGADKLVAGSNQLAKGANDVAAGWDGIIGHLNELQAGEQKVLVGSKQLNTGLSKLESGAVKFSDGANQLKDGSNELTAGLNKLNDGSSELASKLQSAAKETAINPSDETFNMFANPVSLKTEKLSSVPNYGTGFTPYFLSLGLYVGALILSIVFPMREAAGIPGSSFSWYFSKTSLLIGFSLIQTVLVDLLLLYGLDLDVQNVGLFFLFSFITSLTFVSLVQLLVTTLGDPGRFIAIIILILQLTTSAGTFPLELIPDALQQFNAWLPMTYSVAGFKAVVSSGDFSFMWDNVIFLVSFIVVFSLGTFLYFRRSYRRHYHTFSNKGVNETAQM